MRIAFLAFFSLISFLKLLAQGYPGSNYPKSGNGTSSYPSSSSTSNPSNTLGEEEPDTAKVVFFFAQQPERQYILSDTSLDNHFQQYLAGRKRNDEYAYLGYAGSAARPLVWQPRNRMGFDLGFHQFDIYWFKNQDFKYYNTDKSFSQGKWTFHSLGNDSNLDFEYGGHFKKDVFLTLNWQRINTSNEGFYKLSDQSAINSNWGIALAQLGKRYNWFLNLSSNGFQQVDNGGIVNDVALRNKDTVLIGGRKSIQTRISGANPLNLAYTVRDVQWRHTWRLNGSDSSARNFQLVHQANFRQTKYKAYAKLGESRTAVLQKNDSLFFGDLLTYNKGARLFLSVQNLDNQISIASAKKSMRDGVSSVGNTFEAGLRHQWFNVDDGNSKEKVQNLFAFGNINFNTFQRFQLSTAAHLGLLAENVGEYRAEGNIFFDLKPVGNLEGKLVQQRYQPTFMERRFYNIQKEVWNNDFKKIFETSFSAIYRLPKIGFSAEAAYHLINNYIYFNKDLKPTQEKEAVSIFQLNFSESLKIRHLGFENFVSFQQTSNKSVHLPTLTGKHSLFLEGRIFRNKVMLARIGLDFRYTTDYQADSYHPFIGQFYWQDEQNVTLFPALDAYISAKVTKTRVFFKIENWTRSLSKKNVFYAVPNYPMYDTYFRIGVQRRFTD